MDDASDWREVAPVSPAAGWIGGKKQLAKRLCALIEAEPHRVYAEPFVGMGGVFFRRRRAARVEAINDADRDVANFFRILQRHYPQLMDTLKWQVASRADFERLAAQPPELLTDLERAARFLDPAEARLWREGSRAQFRDRHAWPGAVRPQPARRRAGGRP